MWSYAITGSQFRWHISRDADISKISFDTKKHWISECLDRMRILTSSWPLTLLIIIVFMLIIIVDPHCHHVDPHCHHVDQSPYLASACRRAWWPAGWRSARGRWTAPPPPGVSWRDVDSRVKIRIENHRKDEKDEQHPANSCLEISGSSHMYLRSNRKIRRGIFAS